MGRFLTALIVWAESEYILLGRALWQLTVANEGEQAPIQFKNLCYSKAPLFKTDSI